MSGSITDLQKLETIREQIDAFLLDVGLENSNKVHEEIIDMKKVRLTIYTQELPKLLTAVKTQNEIEKSLQSLEEVRSSLNSTLENMRGTREKAEEVQRRIKVLEASIKEDEAKIVGNNGVVQHCDQRFENFCVKYSEMTGNVATVPSKKNTWLTDRRKDFITDSTSR